VINVPSSRTRKLRFCQLETFHVPPGICCSASQATSGATVVLDVLVVVVVVTASTETVPAARIARVKAILKYGNDVVLVGYIGLATLRLVKSAI